MAGTIPTQDEVLTYFDKLSNWGRWGKEDELGTLNFLSPAKTKRAVSLVEDGMTVSCARTISWESAPDVSSTPIHYMVESGEGWASGDKVTTRAAQGSTDFFGLVSWLYDHAYRQPRPLFLGGQDVQRQARPSYIDEHGGDGRIR